MPETPETDTLRLTSLEVENVLRIQAMTLKMGQDNVIVIEGGNEQGKSSALACVEMMFAGGMVVPPEPLHGDAKRGHIIARVGALVVTRKFRAGKPPQFSVTMAGKKLAKPQTIMEEMLHRQTLDPLKFMSMDDKERRDVLGKVMGFDSSEFDGKHAELFEARKVAKRDAKRLMNAFHEARFHHDAPDEEVKVSELMEELKRRQEFNEEIRSRQAAVVTMQDAITEGTRHWNAVNCNITDLKEELAKRVAGRAALDKSLTAQRSDLVAATELAHKDNPENETEITAQIEAADGLNSKRRDNDRSDDLRADSQAADRKAEKLDDELKELATEKEKARLAARERLPVPDLDISEDAVLYKGKPFSQAGGSAQLRVSTAVAIALNKDKRVKLLLIDDAEKLDAAGTRMLLEMAKDAGFQVVMTRVLREGPASEGAVVIEDGTVKE